MIKIGYLWVVVQVRDRAWFVRLYGEIIPSFFIDRTGAQTMLFLTCTMISSVDLAHCGVSRATDLWIVIQLIHKSVLLYLMFGLYVCNLCFMRGKRKTGFSERATLLNEFDFLTYLVSLQVLK